MNNILVVNVNWLGDAVFSLAVFAHLRREFPQAKITCMCVPRVKEVLSYSPDIDEIIVFNDQGPDKNPLRWLGIIRKLRKGRYDKAYFLHRSTLRAFVVRLAGIKQRIGYSKTGHWLSRHVLMPSEDSHRADIYLNVLKADGILLKKYDVCLRVGEQDVADIRNLLGKEVDLAKPYVVLNTGGNWNLKRWSKERWSELARRLVGFGVQVVFSGGVDDQHLVAGIMQQANIQTGNFAGKTTLGQSLALYKFAHCVISADSGPLHLANAVGARIIGLFGPTRPEITGPYNQNGTQVIFRDSGCNKAPCYHLGCASQECMNLIKVDDVLKAIGAIKA